ncbi:MAG: hypothetical protein M3O22_04955 [Pseudomonadota bacterium]|nr:hypothetical protein [Pseudomonadota bacterium]
MAVTNKLEEAVARDFSALSLQNTNFSVQFLRAADCVFYALIEALPYVECAEEDPVYKKGAVAKVVRVIRAAIAAYEKAKGEKETHDKYPYSGTISKIEPINEDDLPAFKDLYGMAPNATKGVQPPNAPGDVRE